MFETDRTKEFHNNILQNFLNNNNTKHYTRNTYLGAVFAERFNRTTRDLLIKLVFEKGVSNWVDIFATITKQYNNRIHSYIELTPKQASSKK